MTTASAVRWAPATATHRLAVPRIGEVDVTVRDRDRVQPFLLLHGGAGPASVAGFGDLLAARKHARVITPNHPGFDGTPGPARWPASPAWPVSTPRCLAGWMCGTSP